MAVEGVFCYDCHSELGTCNDGECEGAVCLKMETSNRDNDRRTVQKGCGERYEENGCQQSTFGSKWTSRCVCGQSMCNGDDALVAAGLESSSDNNRTLASLQLLTSLTFLFFLAAAMRPFFILNAKFAFYFSSIYFTAQHLNDYCAS
ncbi:unnamed protein product [Thelazia callipaeda]|uniref:Activin_recp domain-containing protein n=1 Tax=Thelazia callipaeda TaxID=103827 RepID=A0A0N5CJ33_THECL|nr:unnamed protein product [Thelazia callipaeda]